MNVSHEVAALQRLSTRELRAKYTELFHAGAQSFSRDWLVKRIVWQMQARKEGGLSERARLRAVELARTADLRITPAPEAPETPPAPRPPQVPAARPVSLQGLATGTVLTRVYKGQRLEVRVQPDGFEFDGSIYTSLTAVAYAITGARWNGRLFFGLTAKGGAR